MKKNKDKKIQKLAQKILDFDSKYPLNDFIIYFYIIFFILIFTCLYALILLLVIFPELNYLPLNYNYVGIILFWIVALCSLWISVIFERKLARQIHDAVINLLDKWIRNLPVWMYRVGILILIFGLIYLVNTSIEYSFGQFYNVVIKNTINTLARWSSGLVAVFSLFFQLCIINTSDLRIGMLIKNESGNEKLITDSYVGDYLKDNTTLEVIATNKGKAKATYRIWGICTQDENFDLYNKELSSKLVQPKIYYKKGTKRQSINEKGELLGENESSNMYYLEFDEAPKENFQIVFLEYPNKLNFVPIYVKRKNKDYSFLKSKLFYIPIITIIILIMATPFVRKEINIISRNDKKIITINNKNYELLKEKNYMKENLYTVADMNLKIRHLSFYRTNSNIECLLTMDVSTNKQPLYLKKCKVVTKNKRKYNANIESIYQLNRKNIIQYKIFINMGHLDHVKDINELTISCLNLNNNREDNLDLVLE